MPTYQQSLAQAIPYSGGGMPSLQQHASKDQHTRAHVVANTLCREKTDTLSADSQQLHFAAPSSQASHPSIHSAYVHSDLPPFTTAAPASAITAMSRDTDHLHSQYTNAPSSLNLSADSVAPPNDYTFFHSILLPFLSQQQLRTRQQLPATSSNVSPNVFPTPAQSIDTDLASLTNMTKNTSALMTRSMAPPHSVHTEPSFGMRHPFTGHSAPSATDTMLRALPIPGAKNSSPVYISSPIEERHDLISPITPNPFARMGSLSADDKQASFFASDILFPDQSMSSTTTLSRNMQVSADKSHPPLNTMFHSMPNSSIMTSNTFQTRSPMPTTNSPIHPLTEAPSMAPLHPQNRASINPNQVFFLHSSSQRQASDVQSIGHLIEDPGPPPNALRLFIQSQDMNQTISPSTTLPSRHAMEKGPAVPIRQSVALSQHELPSPMKTVFSKNTAIAADTLFPDMETDVRHPADASPVLAISSEDISDNATDLVAIYPLVNDESTVVNHEHRAHSNPSDKETSTRVADDRPAKGLDPMRHVQLGSTKHSSPSFELSPEKKPSWSKKRHELDESCQHAHIDKRPDSQLGSETLERAKEPVEESQSVTCTPSATTLSSHGDESWSFDAPATHQSPARDTDKPVGSMYMKPLKREYRRRKNQQNVLENPSISFAQGALRGSVDVLAATGMSSALPLELEQHMSQEAAAALGPTSFICTDRDGNQFNLKDWIHDIQQELKNSATPMLIPCPFEGCGKSFEKMYNLKSHIVCHLDTKPHACAQCGASFRRSHDLRRHIRSTHTSEKPFRCPVCGKNFARKDHYQRHMNIEAKHGRY